MGDDDPRLGEMRQKITDSTNILNVEKSASQIDWVTDAIVKYEQFQPRRLPMRCLMMSGLFLAMCLLAGQVSGGDALRQSVAEIKKEKYIPDEVSAVKLNSYCEATGCVGTYDVYLGSQKVPCKFTPVGKWMPSFCFITKDARKCLYADPLKSFLGNNPDVITNWITCEGKFTASTNTPGQQPVTVDCGATYAQCKGTYDVSVDMTDLLK